MLVLKLQNRVLKLNCFPCNFWLIGSNKTLTLNLDHLTKRQLFWEQEKVIQTKIKVYLLTEEEKTIHDKHNEAIQNGHFSYNDPISNEKIITRLRHFLRGSCCGKACRHCIYEHSNVTDERRKKQYTFNSAFWVLNPNQEDYDDKHYFDGSNIKRVKTKPTYSSQLLIKSPIQK